MLCWSYEDHQHSGPPSTMAGSRSPLAGGGRDRDHAGREARRQARTDRRAEETAKAIRPVRARAVAAPAGGRQDLAMGRSRPDRVASGSPLTDEQGDLPRYELSPQAPAGRVGKRGGTASGGSGVG